MVAIEMLAELRVAVAILIFNPVEQGLRMVRKLGTFVSFSVMREPVTVDWTIIGDTSVAGLRETFLQREGKLTYGETRWQLLVQRKTLDILLDQVPWSIAIVYHPWMAGALHVSW